MSNLYNCSHTQSIPWSNLDPVDGKLYIYLSNKTTDKLPLKQIHDVIYSMKFWNKYLPSNVRIYRTFDKSKADITIKFATNDTAPKPFGTKTIAYAFRVNSVRSWEIWVNDSYDFATWDLRKVLCHEIWHSLNLAHNPDDKTCIMYPKHIKWMPDTLSEEWRNSLIKMYL